jgi:hypothetical protein
MTISPLHGETVEPVAWQRRNIGRDGTPWSSWCMADDLPTPENMKWDGYFTYQYRPLYPGDPIPDPSERTPATAADREYDPGMNPADDAEFGMKP